MKVHVLTEPGREAKDVQTVFMLHCAGFHGKSFGKVARILNDSCEKRLRVLAPDLRAHGDTSVGTDTGFTWFEMAEDLTALVRSEGLEGKTVAVGHSLGAVVAVIAEIENPGLFKGLWCFEPVLFSEEELGLLYSQFFASKAKGRKAKFESYSQAFDNFSRKFPMKGFDRECLQDYIMHGFRDTGRGVEMKCEPESEAHTYMAGYQTYERGIYKRFNQIMCPIVLACGTNIGKENGVSRGSDHYLGEFLTGRLERYGHLSHFGPYEAPELIAERIRLFLVDQLGQGIKMPRYLSFLRSNY